MKFDIFRAENPAYISAEIPSDIPLSIYFGGAGFGAVFYAGVYSAMVEKWGKDFYKHTVLLGDSAGAIFAVGIALGKSPEYLNTMYRKFCMNTDRKGGLGSVHLFVEEGIREMFGDDLTVYQKIENRCFIGSTSFFLKHKWQSTFENNEDLIRHMMHSCQIPIFFGNTPQMDVKTLDGSYSFYYNDLPHGNSTLCICVVDDVAEIIMSTRYENMIECYTPIVGEKYDAYFNEGKQRMHAWDGNYNRKVGKKKTPYARILFLWTAYAIERLHSLSSKEQTSKERTSKERTSKERTAKARTSKTRTYKTRTDTV